MHTPPASQPSAAVPRFSRWAAAALLCLGLAGLLYGAAVHTGTGQLLDSMMRLTAHGTDHPLPDLDPDNRWIAVWVLGPPGIALLLLLTGRPRPVRMVTAAAAAALVLGSNLTTQAFKTLWSGRPELLQGMANDWTANSLPSGHTTMAAAAAAAVFLAASPRDRPFWAVPGALWAGGWGGYIFVEGWHRPSDMIAAYLVVTAWACAAGWVVLGAEGAAVRSASGGAGVPIRAQIGAAQINPADLAPPLRDGRHPGGRNAGLCLTLGVLGSVLGSVFLFGPVFGSEGGVLEALAQSAGSPTPWLWLAGAAFSSAPAFFPATAGILAFSAVTTAQHR